MTGATADVSVALGRIEAKLDRVILDNHALAQDVADLKQWRAAVEGRGRGWMEAGGMGKMLIGGLIGALSYFGLSVAVTPAHNQAVDRVTVASSK